MFAHHNPHIMDIRGESVNMLVLLRAVPKIHLGAVAYLEAYIDFVKPKLILSRTDNNATLWQLKRRPNSTYKVALIQNGWRLDLEFEMPMLLGSAGRHNQWFADQVFAYGPTWPAQIARTTRANGVVAGSLLCNSISWKDSSEQSQTIALVSTFRSEYLKNQLDLGVQLYLGLNKYLTQSYRKLLVIGFSGPDRIIEESQFIEKHFTTVDWSIESRENRMSSYENLRRVDVVLVDQSSLGYEMLGVGKRVGFIAAMEWSRQTHRFGKPLEFGEKGLFWTNDPSEEEIGRILDYLLTVSDEQWERDSGWTRDQLMVHDYGNTKIRAYVEGVLTGSLKSN
jgi:surface carbohydrate biosynthesis protein